MHDVPSSSDAHTNTTSLCDSRPLPLNLGGVSPLRQHRGSSRRSPPTVSIDVPRSPLTFQSAPTSHNTSYSRPTSSMTRKSDAITTIHDSTISHPLVWLHRHPRSTTNNRCGDDAPSSSSSSSTSSSSSSSSCPPEEDDDAFGATIAYDSATSVPSPSTAMRDAPHWPIPTNHHHHQQQQRQPPNTTLVSPSTQPHTHPHTYVRDSSHQSSLHDAVQDLYQKSNNTNNMDADVLNEAKSERSHTECGSAELGEMYQDDDDDDDVEEADVVESVYANAPWPSRVFHVTTRARDSTANTANNNNNTTVASAEHLRSPGIDGDADVNHLHFQERPMTHPPISIVGVVPSTSAAPPHHLNNNNNIDGHAEINRVASNARAGGGGAMPAAAVAGTFANEQHQHTPYAHIYSGPEFLFTPSDASPLGSGDAHELETHMTDVSDNCSAINVLPPSRTRSRHPTNTTSLMQVEMDGGLGGGGAYRAATSSSIALGVVGRVLADANSTHSNTVISSSMIPSFMSVSQLDAALHRPAHTRVSPSRRSTTPSLLDDSLDYFVDVSGAVSYVMGPTTQVELSQQWRELEKEKGTWLLPLFTDDVGVGVGVGGDAAHTTAATSSSTTPTPSRGMMMLMSASPPLDAAFGVPISTQSSVDAVKSPVSMKSAILDGYPFGEDAVVEQRRPHTGAPQRVAMPSTNIATPNTTPTTTTTTTTSSGASLVSQALRRRAGSISPAFSLKSSVHIPNSRGSPSTSSSWM